MKKIFTLAAAVLASFSLWAETIVLSEVTPEENWYEVAGVGRISNKSGSAFSDPDMSCEGITGFKTGSSYFTIQTYAALNGIVVTAQSTSNRTIKAVSVAEELSKSAPSESNVEFELIGSNESYAVPKNECGNEFTLNFKDGVAANSYIQIVFSGNAEIVAVEFNAGTVTPSTDPVATVTLSGDAEAYVGETVTVTAATDVKANAFQWLVNDAVQEGAEAAKFDFKADAAGTYSIVCKAKNDNNADWVASEALEIVVSKKEEQPVGEVCAILLPASSGDTPAKGGEVALLGESKGGKIIFVGAKEDKYEASFLYTERGLQMCKGGADSVRVILDNKLVEGSVIQLKIWNFSADGKERGFKVLSLEKKAVLNASWTPAAEGEEKSFDYTVKKGDGLEGMNAFIIQRNNSAILEAVTVSGCGGEVPTAINNIEEAVKAVKRIVNGQLLIEKNGVLYNAQGNVVK